MSGVNITILEGGKAENFGQVAKLRTNNGSDHDLWVPKTDVETKHLSVKKNGLHYTNQYQPTVSEKKEGKFHDVYGWDTITVSVKKKVKGKKRKTSPSTGLEYDAPTSVDVDDDGNLIETELPVSIEIEIPPSKLEYNDGENISNNGMVVKAYYADDREWGVVPNNEITLEPSVASGDGDEYSDGDGVNAILVTMVNGVGSSGSIIIGDKVLGSMDGNPCTITALSSVATLGSTFLATRYNGNSYFKLVSGHSVPADIATQTNGIWNFSGGSSSVIRSTERFAGGPWGEYFTNLPVSTKNPTEAGEMYPSNQSITACWTPPEGEEELTDTFDITVIPSN